MIHAYNLVILFEVDAKIYVMGITNIYKQMNFHTKSIFIIEHMTAYINRFEKYSSTSVGLRVQIKHVSPNISFIFEDLNNFFLCRVLINNKYTFLSATTLLSFFESWKHIYARVSHLRSTKHEALHFRYFTESHSIYAIYMYT